MKRWLVMGLLSAALAYPATFYVTVAGLGGEAEYEQRFAGWARDIEKTAKGAGAEATTLIGPQATKANLTTELRRLATAAVKDDLVVITLIGHGSFDGSDYKINLPGPDLSGAELAALLDHIAAHQVIVNATSASGASLAALRKPGRVVMTSTKSGTEKNATLFARYWVEALRDASADTDKNEAISAVEAFRYADQKTQKFFESQTRLATEHAMLEDTGKGEGVRAPSAQNGQGLIAARMELIRLGAAQANAGRNPALLKKKQELEEQIDALKYQKAGMPAAEYRAKLTALLTELARTQAELDK